jgi:hypothetical protein
MTTQAQKSGGHAKAQRRLPGAVVYRLLSPWFLLGYVAWLVLGSLVFTGLLHLDYQNALLLSLAITTGSDPRSLPEIAHCSRFLTFTPGQTCSGLWGVTWFAHVLSYLVVPAIVGFVVADRVTIIRMHRRQDVRKALRAYSSRVEELIAERELGRKLTQEEKETIEREAEKEIFAD